MSEFTPEQEERVRQIAAEAVKDVLQDIALRAIVSAGGMITDHERRRVDARRSSDD